MPDASETSAVRLRVPSLRLLRSSTRLQALLLTVALPGTVPLALSVTVTLTLRPSSIRLVVPDRVTVVTSAALTISSPASGLSKLSAG